MASQSLSSSSAPTIPSVLENSDYEEKQSTSGGDASVSYADESFDSESDPVHEAAGGTPVQSDGSSEKYASDEFEDDYEVSDTIDPVPTPEAEGCGSSSESTEENDYDGESFEQGEGPGDDHEAVSIPKYDTQVQESSIESGVDAVKAHVLLPPPDTKLHPQLEAWCSKMILEIRDRSKSERRQSRECKANSVADKMPAAAVKKLIHQVSKSHRHRRPPQQSNAWQYSRKVKVSTSLMQRAETQRWLAASARDTANNQETTQAPAALPTPARFCSVKQEKLLGQLATLRLSEATERWTAPESRGFWLETLELVQNMTARQREIYNASAIEPGGRMLHRVTVEARLQLEESMALRRQAEFLLEDA